MNVIFTDDVSVSAVMPMVEANLRAVLDILLRPLHEGELADGAFSRVDEAGGDSNDFTREGASAELIRVQCYNI